MNLQVTVFPDQDSNRVDLGNTTGDIQSSMSRQAMSFEQVRSYLNNFFIMDITERESEFQTL